MSMEKDTRETTVDTFDDDMSAERAKNAKGTAFRLLKKLMEQKWKLLVIVLSIIVSSLFNILSPKVMGIAINDIFDGVKNALVNGQRFQVNLETMGTVLLGLLGLYQCFPDADPYPTSGDQRQAESFAFTLLRSA